MMAQIIDQTIRNDRFTIFEAQYSFHQKLLDAGFLMPELRIILDAHGEFLQECFIDVGAQYEVHSDLLRISNHDEIQEHVQQVMCKQLAKEIYEKATVQIARGYDVTTSKIQFCIMNKNLRQKVSVPAIMKIEMPK